MRLLAAVLAVLVSAASAIAQEVDYIPTPSGGSAGGGPATSFSTTNNVTANTTQTQGQNPATTQQVRVSTVANWNDVCATLSAAAPGNFHIVINDGANACKVFPASGDNFGEGANASVTLLPKTQAWFIASDDTNWKWIPLYNDGADAGTCADSGDANPGALTLYALHDFVRITNNDAHGCNVTLGEENAREGRTLVVTNLSANKITFSTSAGVQQVNPSVVLGQHGFALFQYAASQWYLVTFSTPNLYSNTVKVGSDVSSSSTAWANLTGESFAVDANTNYRFTFVGMIQAAATTTGGMFSATYPASPNWYWMRCYITTTAGAQEMDWETTSDDMTPTTAVANANTNQPFACEGQLNNGANAGTFQLRIRSEVGGSAFTVKAGSLMNYKVYD